MVRRTPPFPPVLLLVCPIDLSFSLPRLRFFAPSVTAERIQGDPESRFISYENLPVPDAVIRDSLTIFLLPTAGCLVFFLFCQILATTNDPISFIFDLRAL